MMMTSSIVEYLTVAPWLLLSLLTLLLSSASYYSLKGTRRRNDQNLPPGPWKLPIIGSLHHVINSLPHRALRDLARRYGPIMHVQFGEVPMFVISSAEGAADVMRTHDLSLANRPPLTAAKVLTYGMQDLVFAPYGEYWRQLKKTCVLELLSPKRVQSFRSIREDETERVIRSIFEAAGEEVNLSQKLQAYANDTTVRTVIGSRFQGQAAFLEVLSDVVRQLSGMDLPDLFPSSPFANWISGTSSKCLKSRQKLESITDEIIHQRRREQINTEDDNVEDLLDVLLKIHDEGAISMEGLRTVIFDIFAAGSETSSTTTEWAMSELVNNPNIMAKVQTEVRSVITKGTIITEAVTDELPYLKLVVKEALRLHVPVPLLLPRECRKSSQVLGYEVKEGTRVVVNAWAIARDPKYWDEPEKFLPERFEGSSVDFRGTHFQFIPFGAGRRICPGIHFGLANIELLLAQLLYYFNWELPVSTDGGDSKLDMEESFGVTARRKSDLRLRAIPCFPCPEY